MKTYTFYLLDGSSLEYEAESLVSAMTFLEKDLGGKADELVDWWDER